MVAHRNTRMNNLLPNHRTAWCWTRRIRCGQSAACSTKRLQRKASGHSLMVITKATAKRRANFLKFAKVPRENTHTQYWLASNGKNRQSAYQAVLSRDVVAWKYHRAAWFSVQPYCWNQFNLALSSTIVLVNRSLKKITNRRHRYRQRNHRNQNRVVVNPCSFAYFAKVIEINNVRQRNHL